VNLVGHQTCTRETEKGLIDGRGALTIERDKSCLVWKRGVQWHWGKKKDYCQMEGKKVPECGIDSLFGGGGERYERHKKKKKTHRWSKTG